MAVTIVVPAAACGLIIGKGGERINLLREQTQSKIMLQSKEKAVPGLNERTVTINGSLLNAQMVRLGTVFYKFRCFFPSN
jgi:ribosomal protein S3